MKRIAVCIWLTASAAALAMPARAETVTLTGVDCRKLVRHMPDPDVAYQPSVDVYGRSVPPADLEDVPGIRVPDTITFDAAVDLGRFGIPPSSPLFEPNVRIGEIRVESDGRVFFNGEPLQSREIAALEALCRERLLPR